MAIDYVICAAGEGSRTRLINPGLAKPILKINNKTLLEYSIESLDLYPGDQLIIIVQKKHKIVEQMCSKFTFFDVKIHWIELELLTRGQLETALAAERVLNPNSSIVIFNADTYFRSRSLGNLILQKNIQGIIPCTKALGDAWSFCKIKDDSSMIVTEVAEKVRISDWCSVGYYYFKDQSLFISLAKEAIKNPSLNEHYVAPLYNKLIEINLKVIVTEVDVFKPMGTIEQLQAYWELDLKKMKLFNPRGVMVIDLDGTLTIDDPLQSYANKAPREEVIQCIRRLDTIGYKIIISTARRMKTHSNDSAKVIADIGDTTISWLKKHNVPFHGLQFGKPYADNGYYVDDRSLQPEELIRRFDELFVN